MAIWVEYFFLKFDSGFWCFNDESCDA